ncbi:MAG TPA: uracil-DNA glycosylase [Mycobacteriales bacterium]|nr:uracil-DNA glycosylase [Mycobacteriales bacterium]
MAGAIGPHGPGVGGPRVRLVPGSLEVAQAAAGCASWAELATAAATCTACPELAATRMTVVVGDHPAGWPAGAGAVSGALTGAAGGGAGATGAAAARAGAVGAAATGAGAAGVGLAGGPAAGAPGADRRPGVPLVLVGEAPGADEDKAGRPFVGRAGRLLDELLAEAGLNRAELAVLNVLQCRPPGNRPPKPAEIARCRGWLDRKLELLHPGLVCALGRTAAGWFLGSGSTLAAARGRVHEVAGRRVIVTYHPSAAIRYGPNGEPIAGLRADLALIASLLAAAPTC